ncbi:MAG TPA: DUF4131 domain-containing protein, partial [Hymenobacter sp.]
MITWATFPFVRYTPALIAGIAAALYFGATGPALWPYATALAGLAALLLFWSVRQPTPGATDAAGALALLAVAGCGAALAQQATESRRADHLLRWANQVECYQAVVDEPAVVRPATFATTLRVQAVRVAGQWRRARGGVRVSLPREPGVGAPQYGEVWLVDGPPSPSKP